MIQSTIKTIISEFTSIGVYATELAQEQTAIMEQNKPFCLVEPTTCIDSSDSHSPSTLNIEIRLLYPDRGTDYLRCFSDAVNICRGIMMRHTGASCIYSPIILTSPSYSGCLCQINVPVIPASTCAIHVSPDIMSFSGYTTTTETPDLTDLTSNTKLEGVFTVDLQYQGYVWFVCKYSVTIKKDGFVVPTTETTINGLRYNRTNMVNAGSYTFCVELNEL